MNWKNFREFSVLSLIISFVWKNFREYLIFFTMTHTIKLDALPLGSAKTYLFTIVFVVGNLLLPQLAHLIPQGGLIFLPIYFFTLIAAYKYGIHVGVLTAILSPLVNNLLFSISSGQFFCNLCKSSMQICKNRKFLIRELLLNTFICANCLLLLTCRANPFCFPCGPR